VDDAHVIVQCRGRVRHARGGRATGDHRAYYLARFSGLPRPTRRWPFSLPSGGRPRTTKSTTVRRAWWATAPSRCRSSRPNPKYESHGITKRSCTDRLNTIRATTVPPYERREDRTSSEGALPLVRSSLFRAAPVQRISDQYRARMREWSASSRAANS